MFWMLDPLGTEVTVKIAIRKEDVPACDIG